MGELNDKGRGSEECQAPARHDRAFYWIGSRFFLQMAKLLLRVQVQGREQIPRRGRLLIACNHISLFDPPLVGISIPREVHYAAKASLFKGGWDRFFRWLNAVPVRRRGVDKEAVETLLDVLNRDETVLIFPEGTNSPTGVELPVKPGIGLLALRSDTMILPARIDGTQHAERGWKHLLGFILRKHGRGIRIRFGDPFDPKALVTNEMDRHEAYRLIAEYTMDAIRALKSSDIEYK